MADVSSTIDAYFSAFNARDHDRWVSLFTQDAHQEDPVGQPVNIGHEAIGAFFDLIGTFGTVTIEANRPPIIVGNEAMVFLNAATQTDAGRMRVPYIVDHMTFNDDGLITSLRAFWDNDSITTETD